jgi:hypothetical protein
MPNHELFDFLRQSSASIQDEYDVITRRSSEDPGTAGDEGEENWCKLLRDWLPNTYRVITKGRVIFHSGEASPQMDLLVLSPEYPQGLINAGKKLYLAGGVVAAFECKLTLRQRDITKAFANARKLSDGTARRWGSPYRELHRPLIYGLLAHSHDWKSEGSRPEQNVNEGLTAELNGLDHPRQLLDLICVSDLGTWTSMRALTRGHHEIDRKGAATWKAPSSRSVHAGYGLHRKAEHLNASNPITNVAAMVVDLLSRIGRERPGLRPIVNYFRAIPGLAGDSRGSTRTWLAEAVLSRAVLEELAKLDSEPPPGISLVRDTDDRQWSEWGPFFEG